jgi:hypothetical protein
MICSNSSLRCNLTILLRFEVVFKASSQSVSLIRRTILCHCRRNLLPFIYLEVSKEPRGSSSIAHDLYRSLKSRRVIHSRISTRPCLWWNVFINIAGHQNPGSTGFSFEELRAFRLITRELCGDYSGVFRSPLSVPHICEC